MLTLWVLAALTLAQQPQPAEPHDGVVSVRAFGARGDGVSDDTGAFERAIAAVAAAGGVVRIPSVGPGNGYVLTHTVRVPAGVALIGSPAGFANKAWAAFPTPEKLIVGSKILARPAPDQYTGPRKRPLFELPGGSTVRGLWIFYDQQPWPTDEEFADPKSPYHYATFADARRGFIAKHVKPYGPTFYATGPNVVIEDIICDRYYDFFMQARSAKTWVDRISLYGYRRGFVYLECLDVNRLSRVHLVPNVGPACPGKAGPNRTYSWIYGIVVSSSDNVGIQIGRSDGYVLSDVFFFGVHTALRLGASRRFPVHDPVAGVDAFEDPATGERKGFTQSYVAQGPWGSVNGLMADLCTVGIHLVWPANLSNRMANVSVHTGFTDGSVFETTDGDAAKPIGRQAVVLVEPSHARATNIGFFPALMLTNVLVASFSVPASFAGASVNASDANGRVFLLDGEATIEVANMQIDSPYTDAMTVAFGKECKASSIRIRGLTRTGTPVDDLTAKRP